MTDGMGPILTTFTAISTLALVVTGGLAFLHRPSRAAITWCGAFAFATVSGYLCIAAYMLQSRLLFALFIGMIFAMVPLLWLGLRLHRGALHARWWFTYSFIVAQIAVLLIAAETTAFRLVSRILLLAIAVFVWLIVRELFAVRPKHREEVLPLGITAMLFPFFAIYSIVEVGTALAAGASLEELPPLVGEAQLVSITTFVVGALVTVILLARRPEEPLESSQSAFEVVARDRLRRAKQANDQWWSLLDIRVDDPADIRIAFGGAQYARISAAFARSMREALPADADISSPNDMQVIVLLPRQPDRVRQRLIVLLERVSRPQPATQLPMRVSASIGWASVNTEGYELDALRRAASEAADEAQLRGGDRWVRAGSESSSRRRPTTANTAIVTDS